MSGGRFAGVRGVWYTTDGAAVIGHCGKRFRRHNNSSGRLLRLQHPQKQSKIFLVRAPRLLESRKSLPSQLT